MRLVPPGGEPPFFAISLPCTPFRDHGRCGKLDPEQRTPRERKRQRRSSPGLRPAQDDNRIKGDEMHNFVVTYFQWCLFPVSLIGQWIVGQKRASGWLFGLGTQVLWATYAIALGQPGMLVGTTCYAFTYARNYWKWTHGSDRSGKEEA